MLAKGPDVDYFEVTLREKETCGEDVLTCRFDRPEGYTFAPGQHFFLQLETVAGPLAKPFSHAAAPSDDYIEMTTRLSGSVFKRTLLEYERGASAGVSGPVGRFVLPPDPGRVVFLIGGVGITPVRSMLRDAVRRRTGLAGVLVFGNRSPECVPYREELESYREHGIDVVHVFEHAEGAWAGDTGFITAEIVSRHARPDEDLFVTAGPPVMVAAMERCMDALEVPEQRRLVERFGGYA